MRKKYKFVNFEDVVQEVPVSNPHDKYENAQYIVTGEDSGYSCYCHNIDEVYNAVEEAMSEELEGPYKDQLSEEVSDRLAATIYPYTKELDAVNKNKSAFNQYHNLKDIVYKFNRYTGANVKLICSK